MAGQPVNFGTMAHDHEIYMMLADTAAEMHEVEGLQKYATLLTQLAARDEHQLYLAIAYRAMGIAHRLEGRRGEAESLLQQALSIFKELNTRWQTGRTLLELAELESGRAKKNGARRYYLEALDIFEHMQALPYVKRTEAALAPLS